VEEPWLLLWQFSLFWQRFGDGVEWLQVSMLFEAKLSLSLVQALVSEKVIYCYVVSSGIDNSNRNKKKEHKDK